MAEGARCRMLFYADDVPSEAFSPAGLEIPTEAFTPPGSVSQVKGSSPELLYCLLVVGHFIYPLARRYPVDISLDKFTYSYMFPYRNKELQPNDVEMLTELLV